MPHQIEANTMNLCVQRAVHLWVNQIKFFLWPHLSGKLKLHKTSWWIKV